MALKLRTQLEMAYILGYTIELGRVEGLIYLGDFGGQDAIPVFEEALKQEAPEETVKTALRKIRARLGYR